MKIKKKERKYFIFISLIFLITGLFGISTFLLRGATIPFYFSCDTNDTYMDHFHMLSNIEGLDPYYKNANYPAGAFLFLRVLYRIVPWNQENSNGFFLRDNMYAQLGLIILLLSCIIIVRELVVYKLPEEKIYRIFLPISILFSGPFLFAIERGNIIILSFVFSLAFIVFFDSGKKSLRYISYICLAISASIKIYPAVLGMLVIARKRYKESLVLVTLGIIVFVLPFLAFDGIESFMIMLKGIFISSSENLSLGYGYNFSFNNLIRIGYAFGGQYKDVLPSFILLIPICICVLIYVLNKELWKKAFSLVLFMIWVPSFSYTYSLLFLVLPLMLFLREDKRQFDYCYAIFYAIILAPWGLPKIDCINFINGYEFKFYLTYGMLIINITIVIFALFLIVDGGRKYFIGGTVKDERA